MRLNSMMMCGWMLLLLLVCCAVQATPTLEPLTLITQAHVAFSRDLNQALRGTEGNLVSSPLSAQLALAQALAGARGETANEMARVLRLPSDPDTTRQGLESLVSSLQSLRSTKISSLTSSSPSESEIWTSPHTEAQDEIISVGYEPKICLELASKMYVRRGVSLRPDFLELVAATFRSTPEAVDFTDPTTPDLINSWVESSTERKIKHLISEGSLDSLTQLVLVNAVYFKGPWLSPFPHRFTHLRPFHVDAVTSMDTPMMHQDCEFHHADLPHLDAQLLQLLYLREELSLVVLLPNTVTGLPLLEERLQHEDLTNLLSRVEPKKMDVFLPRFKIETTLNLNDLLRGLGMVRMFGPLADFSGMIDVAAELRVSKVVQKCFIDVSENGTEAAAASAIGIVVRSSSQQTFLADHPFLFRLVLRSPATLHSPVVLFSGRYVLPGPTTASTTA